MPTADAFEYDVFLSFSRADEPLVRPVWKYLSACGLRVFWSDASLQERLGESWFEAIEQSLERSRHFLVVCTPASMSSEWVKREYRAFHSHCFRPGSRRLLPLLAAGYQAADLPLFLRELEACALDGPVSLQAVARLLGGNELESLRARLSAQEEENLALHAAVRRLSDELERVKGLASAEPVRHPSSTLGPATETRPVVTLPHQTNARAGVAAALTADHTKTYSTPTRSIGTSRSDTRDEFMSHDFDMTEFKKPLPAARDALFCGISLIRVIQQLDYTIEQGLHAGLRASFVLLNPENRQAVEMAAFRNLHRKDANDVLLTLHEALSRLTILSQIAKDTPGSLEIRVVDYIVPYTIMALDPDLPTGIINVRLMSFRYPNDRRPSFTLRGHDGEWFQFFRDQARLLWKHGRPI